VALTNLTVKSRTLGDGANAAFAIPFTVIVSDSSETLVYIRNEAVSPHTETLQVEGSANDYTLTGAVPPGFNTTVTFTAGNIPAATDRVVIVRKLPLTQVLDLITTGKYQAVSQEEAYDRIAAMVQELDEKYSRSIQVELTTPLSNIQIPINPTNSDKILAINATGTGLAVGITTVALLAAETNAAASATAAASSATAAASSASTASTAATNAGTSETNAATSATNAATSATNAATSATNAGTSETNAATSATNAATSATNAGTSETNAATSATNAANSAIANFSQGVLFSTFASSPIAPIDGDVGKVFAIDCTGGNVVVNLPAISAIVLDPFCYLFKKTDSSANTVTINRSGTDTIDSGTALTISAQNDGYFLMPEDSTSPDQWISVPFTTGASGVLLAANNLSDVASAATSRSNLVLGNVDNTSDTTKNAAVATLTNKTLTTPVVNSPTGIVKGDVGLGNVDNTSDATKDAAVATLTNKTLTSPVVNSPTGIVKGDVGLGNVDNTSNATERAATATLTSKTFDDAVTQKEIATPSTPAATYHKLYHKSDNLLYTLDDTGAEAAIGNTESQIVSKSFNPGNAQWKVYHDNLTAVVTTGPVGPLGMHKAGIGTGNGVNPVAVAAADDDRVGLYNIQTPSAGTGTGGYSIFYSALTAFRLGDGQHRIGFAFRMASAIPDATNDYLIFMGLDLDNNSPGTYLTGFFADRTLSTTNWYARSRRASSDTDTDTGVAMDTSWHAFEVLINTDNTSHTYYIDGVLVATHTTNMPNAAMGLKIITTRVAGAARNNYLDWLYYAQKPTVVRDTLHTWI